MGEVVFISRYIQPTFGRTFFAPFRDDADGMGFMAQRDFLHFSSRRHFEIQRDGDGVHDRLNIAIADMATIFAQMRRNPVSTRLLRDELPRHAHTCHRLKCDDRA